MTAIENTWLCALWVVGYSWYAGFAIYLTEKRLVYGWLFSVIIYMQGLLLIVVEVLNLSQDHIALIIHNLRTNP